jgi:hypothetical protein
VALGVVSALGSGCTAGIEPDSLAVKITNDSPRTVSIQTCGAPGCAVVVKIDGVTRVGPGSTVTEGWVNPDRGDAAAFEIRQSDGVRRCLSIRYRKGQKVARTRTSAARTCPLRG